MKSFVSESDTAVAAADGATAPPRRIEAVDFARGLAVTLMILSHGVKGLLSFERIPDWGLVPVHLVTKFSSSLFMLVFGVSLAVAILPRVGTPSWPETRTRLFLRGLVILFWYKTLTIVEMMHLHSRQDVLNALMYRVFPVYVEILGFYALALLWVPLTLPAWGHLKSWMKPFVPIGFGLLAWELSRSFHFWGNETLQALLVEHPKHYTWGQLARAPLVFSGLILGEALARSYWGVRSRSRFSAALLVSGAGFLAFFFWEVRAGLYEALTAVAKNEGKHPPELGFMLFSVGGALILLGLALQGGDRLARLVRPVTSIGRNALQAFIFHIFVLFVFYRYLFDHWQNVSYGRALALAALLILMTAVWISLIRFVQKRS